MCLFCFPKTGFALEKNEVQIDSYKLHIRENSNSEATPIKNVKVNIFGSNKNDNKPFLLGTTVSDEDGGINNLHYRAQKDFDQVHFQYMFGNDERGYVIRLSNYKYNANVTRDIPANRKIDRKGIGSISGPELPPEFYVKLAKLNNAYNEVYQNQQLAIEKARPYIDIRQIDFKPINIIYDTKEELLGGGFNRYGHGEHVREPILVLSTTSFINDADFRAAVAHEWAHWNMYRVTGLPGGTYQSHYDQVNPYVSYKEGWAIFQRHRFTCGLENELFYEDHVQNDKRLYGFSTNTTVKGALYDIYDMNFPKNQIKENDEFDIYSAFVNGNHSIMDKDLISEGIMYTLMVKSEASTFQEFYNYLMTNYIDKHSDKSLKGKLENAVGINGINKDGSFKYSNSLKTLGDYIENFEQPEQILGDDHEH